MLGISTSVRLHTWPALREAFVVVRGKKGRLRFQLDKAKLARCFRSLNACVYLAYFKKLPVITLLELKTAARYRYDYQSV